MFNLCQAFSCLPGPGGLKDQDSRDMWILKTVHNAYAEKAEQDLVKAQREAQRGTQRP